MNRSRIAVFVSFSGSGGVEKMVTHLCRGFMAAGHAVDVLLVKSRGGHLEKLPLGARLVKLGSEHTFLTLFPLMRYLKKERPDALLAVKARAIETAVAARMLSRSRTRLIGRLGTTLGAALKDKNPLRKWAWYLAMRSFYPGVDALVAVSRGVAHDLSRITGLEANRIRVIENPVVGPALHENAKRPAAHPWFSEPGDPIVVAMGRLTRQKGLDVLMRAFALLSSRRPCRLVILGEGENRLELEGLARSLGLADRVWMAGFVENPYPFLARASLFVLSSRWEGSPNALTEALGLGVPVVATDCPSGPREILQDGRFGPLVPVEDVPALFEAMERVLAGPPSPAFLRQAVQRYTVDRSTSAYLDVLLGSRSGCRQALFRTSP